MIRLTNVIDIRTGQIYSVAVVRPNMVKWFVQA